MARRLASLVRYQRPAVAWRRLTGFGLCAPCADTTAAVRSKWVPIGLDLPAPPSPLSKSELLSLYDEDAVLLSVQGLKRGINSDALG
eukprot:8439907-Prorocentrum_lima.AAC.1